MSEESKRPRYYVSTKRACKKSGKDLWVDVASIFLSRDGDGYDIVVKDGLANIRQNDRLFIRPVKVKKKADESTSGKK